MKIGVCILLFSIIVADRAQAASPSLNDWTDGILSRLPFKDNSLDRNTYRGYANSFVDEKKRYFDAVFDRLIGSAVKNGQAARADTLRQHREVQLLKLTANVDLATESVFSALDLNKDGIVWRAEALEAIYGFASAADLDGNGSLDGDEQALAEWALSTGNVIADKTDAVAIRKQFREVERATW
jgi:hypothetical protein